MRPPRDTSGWRAAAARWTALVSFGALGIALSACETPPPVVRTDAGPRDAFVSFDTPDALPDPCPPFGAVIELVRTTCPELEPLEQRCVVWDGCSAEIVGPDGSIETVTIVDRQFTTSSFGLDCDARVDDAGDLSLNCLDSIGIGCTADVVSVEIADAPTCCVPGDDRCAGTTETTACTLVSSAGGGAVTTTACVARQMTVVGLGDPCVRGEPGHDDCDVGLFCSALSTLRDAPVCHAICTSDAGCGTGDVCISAGTVPLLGLCAASCDPFAAPDACGAGRGCVPLSAIGPPEATQTICAEAGVAAEGDACAGAACAAGLVCISDGAGGVTPHCRVYCDAAHACPGAETCTPLDSTTTLGACVP